MGKKEFKEATEALREAVKIGPSSGQVHFQLGSSLIELATEQGKGGKMEPDLTWQAKVSFEAASRLINATDGKEKGATSADAFFNAGTRNTVEYEGRGNCLQHQSSYFCFLVI
jgi:hypothetical protein